MRTRCFEPQLSEHHFLLGGPTKSGLLDSLPIAELRGLPDVAAVFIGSEVVCGPFAVEQPPRADQLAGALPYGDQRRVAIGRALALAPRYLLLDEPAAGMSDAECDELVGLIGRVPEHYGCGVLLIEHNMRVIMNACAQIHVIDSGRTIAEGTPAEIQEHPDVVRAYLGSKSEARDARR